MKTWVVGLLVVVLVLLALGSGGAVFWPLEAAVGVVGGLLGLLVGGAAAVLALLVAGLVLLAVVPGTALAVLFALLVAGCAVAGVLMLLLAPVLLPLLLVVGLVWVLARASRPRPPALPPPAA